VQIGGGSPSWPVEQDSPSGVPLPNDGLEDGGAGGGGEGGGAGPPCRWLGGCASIDTFPPSLDGIL
jgi:hypothetical protein